MFSVVINSQNCWLLPSYPNTEDAVRLGVTLPVDAQRSLTGNSSRRPGAITPLHTQEWTASMRAADFFALRNATIAGQNEPIVAPLWAHAYRVGIDTATITAGLVVAWTDGWATYAINPGSLAGYTYAAPLIFGFLHQPPRMISANDDLVTADLSIDEDGPIGYSFAAAAGLLAADTTFNTAGGFAAPIFPFIPEWTKAPVPGAAVVDVERTSLGGGRQKATTFYPQLPELVHQATFKVPTAAGAARLLAWWTRRSGITDPQWVALSTNIGKLSVAPASGDTALHFSGTIAPLGNMGYIALFEPSGRIAIARVASSTSNTINLTAPLAAAWPKQWTTVAPAMLARFTDKEFVLEYRKAGTGWMASCTLNWREVAPEYSVPAGETRGTTIGRLPGNAWFYQIDLDYSGAIASTYLTSWESGATIGGHTWTYNDCAHDKLKQAENLEDDSGSFSMRWYAGCPFENWMPGALAARGFLTIYRADVDTAGALSNFSAVLKSEIVKPVDDGPNVKAKLLGANALFGRDCPTQQMTLGCGTKLFRARCGLLQSNWTFNAVIVSVASNVVVIGTITRAIGGALPAGITAADGFALGWLGWTAGGLPMRNLVMTSTALAGGQITLTLAQPSALAGGTAVTVVPGCDLTAATCQNKYGNYTDNFRGFDKMPSVSPSFIIPQKNATPAKK